MYGRWCVAVVCFHYQVWMTPCKRPRRDLVSRKLFFVNAPIRTGVANAIRFFSFGSGFKQNAIRFERNCCLDPTTPAVFKTFVIAQHLVNGTTLNRRPYTFPIRALGTTMARAPQLWGGKVDKKQTDNRRDCCGNDGCRLFYRIMYTHFVRSFGCRSMNSNRNLSGP